MLTPRTMGKLQALLEEPALEPDPRHFRMFTRAGKVFFSPIDSGELDPSRRTSGRWIPWIGGDGRNRLYVSNGTVTYVPIAEEDRDDVDDQPQPQQVEPVYPTIDGTVMNDPTERPSFDVSGKSSAAVWLCTQRLKCGSTLPTESDDPERLEMTNRGEKPEEVDGEIHRLLFECDLANAGGGARAIKNLDQRIASDVDVTFICEEVEVSEEETSPVTSADMHSSELEDESDPSESGSDPDCPWNLEKVQWYKRRSCYDRNPKRGSVTIGIEVSIDLGPMFRKCRNWYAYISASPGLPRTSPLGPGQSVVGDEIKVALPKRRNLNIPTRFYFTPTPCKKEQFVTVRLESEQKEGVEPDDEEPCCGETAGSKTRSIGFWPAWCGYNGQCGSTTVLPP